MMKEQNLMKTSRSFAAGILAAALMFGGCVMEQPDDLEFADVTQNAEGDCTVSLTATPNSVQGGENVTLSASATCINGTPEYRFWARDPGTLQWIQLQPYDDNTHVWSTVGAAQGTWIIQVWARRQGETIAWEGAANASVTVAAPACTGVSEGTVSPAAPSPAGTTVSIQAVPTCSGTPEYKFWVYNRTTMVWTLGRDWGASDTFSWDTTGLPASGYFIQVWIRAQGTTAPYQAVTNIRYTLGATCGSTALDSVVPASPSDVGTDVTFTASASCSSGSAEFKWWIRPPGGAWTVLQDWNASTSYVWDTTALASGAYRIQVWSRASGSSSFYDGFVTTTHELNVVN